MLPSSSTLRPACPAKLAGNGLLRRPAVLRLSNTASSRHSLRQLNVAVSSSAARAFSRGTFPASRVSSPSLPAPAVPHPPVGPRDGHPRPHVQTAAASASVAGGDASFAPDPSAQEGGRIRWDALPAVTWVDKARAWAFYLLVLLTAMPLIVVMVAIHPLVLLLDGLRRRAQHSVNCLWAQLSFLPFYRTVIEGSENLPAPDAPAVYVANHQSQLDIFTLFALGRPFKFISKASIFYIPIIGWAMYLTGHIPLARTDKKSQMECLKQCLVLLQKGVPVLFFPEGTRSKDGKMGSFKKGAFSIAAKAGVPVVPITLLGTGTLMPNGLEGVLYPSSLLSKVFGFSTVKMVVHQPISGSDADVLCEQAREVIAKTVKENGLEVSE